MSAKSGSIPHDLRRVSRVEVPRQRLDELLRGGPDAAEAHRVWLAEPWPWTPGTEAARAKLRPRWAAAVIEPDAMASVAGLSSEAAVRELNRLHDPWPPESRKPVSSRPPSAAPARES